MFFKGGPTRKVDDFLPRLQVHIGSLDSDMARSFIMDAVVRFCRESKLIRCIKYIPVLACTDSYFIDDLREDERISEILGFKLFYNDKQLDCNAEYYVDNNVLYVDKLPNYPHLVIEIEYSVVPKRDSELVYDVLYEDWLEVIIHATLASLYKLSDMEWFNINLSSYHEQQYLKIVNSSRLHSISKHRALKAELKPKWTSS